MLLLLSTQINCIIKPDLILVEGISIYKVNLLGTLTDRAPPCSASDIPGPTASSYRLDPCQSCVSETKNIADGYRCLQNCTKTNIIVRELRW